MKAIGIDIGYSNVKFSSSNGGDVFPSVLARPSGMLGQVTAGRSLVSFGGKHYLVGNDALEVGQDVWRIGSHDFAGSPEWFILLYAALGQANITGDVTVVTGLPVDYYAAPPAICSASQ